MELLEKTSNVFVVSGREIHSLPSFLPLTRNMKLAIFTLLFPRDLRTLSLLSNTLMTQLLSCKVVTPNLLY
jgi:hypothetical protein